MKEIAKRKAKRAKRGLGRLFKLHAGKQYPAEWQGTAPFRLALRVNGKRIVQALLTPDGKPIFNRAEAEQERLRLVGPALARDKVEALRAVQSKLADAQTELATAETAAAPGIRVADAWDRFEEDRTRPDSGESTLEQYGFQFGRFAKWIKETHPEAVTLRDVTPDMAAEYAANMGKAGFSGGTQNKHLGLLRLVWRILGDAAGVTGDPWAKIARRKDRPHNRRELTPDELRRICETATGELQALLAVGIYSGLRLADAATLRQSEVDMKRGIILRVPAKTARTSGKVVTLPMHPTLRAVLAAQIELHPDAEYILPETATEYNARRDTVTDRVQSHLWENGIACHAPGTGFQLKKNDDGNPVRDEKNGRVILEPTGKRAVLSCGFHSLRHSFVSLCRSAGASLSVVESLVGHSNPTMTRLYSHVGEVEAARAVALLPSVTGAKIEPRREPLPAWARELVATLTAKNVKAVKAELLKVTP